MRFIMSKTFILYRNYTPNVDYKYIFFLRVVCLLCRKHWRICFSVWIAEEGDIETVVEEEKSIDDKISGDVDTEISPPEIEEPKPDVQTSETTESEVQDTLTTENVEIVAAENVETASTDHDEVPVLKDEDKVDHVEVYTS